MQNDGLPCPALREALDTHHWGRWGPTESIDRRTVHAKLLLLLGMNNFLHCIYCYCVQAPGKPSMTIDPVVNVNWCVPSCPRVRSTFMSVIGAVITMQAGIDPICSALHGREGRRELSRNVRPGIPACP